jgi:AraC family transcriptional regulator of adaptative response/methylated-DNA-[protein]-cysteine methyltransferase
MGNASGEVRVEGERQISDDAASLNARAEAYLTIAAAIDWLRCHADAQPSLAELAAVVGLSEFHLQKQFARWAGVSPKRFLQFLAKERARADLLAGEDVMGASLSAGLSGPGRLHDLMVSCTAATPGEIKSGGAGLVFVWGVAATPLGLALLASGPCGMVKLAFLDNDFDSRVAELQADWPAAALQRDDGAIADLAARLFAHYRQPEPVHLFVKGTQFQLKVWEALLQLPAGRLTTYGALAAQLGQPGAARAVGSAVGANPVGLLIPCHRVIRGDGALGGYRWGETRKQALIGLELAMA